MEYQIQKPTHITLIYRPKSTDHLLPIVVGSIDFVYVETQYNLVLCLHDRCQRAVSLQGIRSHLLRQHAAGLLETENVLSKISDIIDLQADGMESVGNASQQPIPAVQGLPIKDGKRCSHCFFVTYSEEGMRKHYRRVHTSDMPDWSDLQDCILQSLSFIGKMSCFPVIPPTFDDTNQRTDIINAFIEKNLTVTQPEIWSEQVQDESQQFFKILGWYQFAEDHDMTTMKHLARPESQETLFTVLQRACFLFIKGGMSVIHSASHTLLQQVLVSHG